MSQSDSESSRIVFDLALVLHILLREISDSLAAKLSVTFTDSFLRGRKYILGIDLHFLRTALCCG